MPETNHPPGEPYHPEVRRERTDANVRAIIWFVVGLGGSALLIHLALLWLFGRFKEREESRTPPLPRLIEQERQRQRQALIPPPEYPVRREMKKAQRSGNRMPSLPRVRDEVDSRVDWDREWQPRLQSDPARDMQDLRAAEELHLSSYGWVNRKKKTVRIPIERAIQLLGNPDTARELGIRVRPNLTSPKRKRGTTDAKRGEQE
jgi:hypothetical protein